jgi:hypothetical protein
MSELSALLDVCFEAGVTPGEMMFDEKPGLCVSTSGAKKLAAIAPNRPAAAELVKTMEQIELLHRSAPAGRA